MVGRLRLLVLAAFACACGGGSGGTAPPPPQAAPVTIETEALEPGNVGFPYFQRLEASGGSAPHSWWVSGSPLPQGLALTENGVLLGTPAAAAATSVSLVVQEAGGAFDVVTFEIEVRDVQIEGALAGSVAPGTVVQLSATGGAPTYAFALSQDMSGGELTTGGAYTAGAQNGVDVVRAFDADGFLDQVAFLVGDDPFAGFFPRWGTSDVWSVEWDMVFDPSAEYATDVDEALATIGLRDPASTDEAGTEADRLARLLVIRRALGYLSRYYGNAEDGSPLPEGLAISFPAPGGAGGGTTPPPGGQTLASPGGYSTICVRHGTSAGVVGTAWLDQGNTRIEHDCGDPSGTSLGVFVNRVLGPYLNAFGNPLGSAPVNAGDVARLETLLFGGAPADARAQTIEQVADGFARVVAAVLAHEIGHSVGLNHASPSDGPGDIMNAALVVGPSVVYRFNASHWMQLAAALPGPNRQ